MRCLRQDPPCFSSSLSISDHFHTTAMLEEPLGKLRASGSRREGVAVTCQADALRSHCRRHCGRGRRAGNKLPVVPRCVQQSQRRCHWATVRDACLSLCLCGIVMYQILLGRGAWAGHCCCYFLLAKLRSFVPTTSLRSRPCASHLTQLCGWSTGSL